MHDKFCSILLLSLAFLLASFNPSLEKVELNLNQPSYQDGVWQSTQGGVIANDLFRVQAQNISYTKKDDAHFLDAKGNVFLFYQDRPFKAQSFHYDFITKKGHLKKASFNYDLWFIRGKDVFIDSDGKVSVDEAELTSCPSSDSEWSALASELTVTEKSLIHTSNLVLKFLKLPFFWLPRLDIDTDEVKGIPIKNRIHFRGARGTSLALSYRFLSLSDWEAFLRLDYNFKKRGGVGLDFNYENQQDDTSYFAKNFITIGPQKSLTSTNPLPQNRYHIEGEFQQSFEQGKTSLEVRYDRLSDYQLISEYGESYTYEQPNKTELRLRRIGHYWISNFYSRVRINPFETVKQELPSVEFSLKPYLIPHTSIFATSRVKLSYLNFVFSDEPAYKHANKKKQEESLDNFDSLRFVLKQDFFRSFWFQNVNFTPRANITGIYYSSGPHAKAVWTHVQSIGYHIQSDFYKHTNNYKHILSPYIDHKLISRPSTAISEHYVFDNDDMLSYLNQIEYGINNALYTKKEGFLERPVSFKVYSYFFPNNATINHKSSQIYFDSYLKNNDRNQHFFQVVWNFPKKHLDFLLYRLSSTLTQKLTTNLEFSHRSANFWRKADRSDFSLEALLEETDMFNTPLSFKRDTILTGLHYQLSPVQSISWATRFVIGSEGRFSSFKEQKLEFTSEIRCNWLLKLAYERTMLEPHRFSISLSLRDSIPKSKPLPRKFV